MTRKILDMVKRLRTPPRLLVRSIATRPTTLPISGTRPPTSGDPEGKPDKAQDGPTHRRRAAVNAERGRTLRSVPPDAKHGRSGLEHLAGGTLPCDRDREQRRRWARRTKDALRVFGIIRAAQRKAGRFRPKADAPALPTRLAVRKVGRRPTRFVEHALTHLFVAEMAFAWRRAEALIG